jgi:hypothetical protein
MRVGNATRRASHVSLEISGRPQPIGGIALHSCDNRRCVNPEHLRWGTYLDNTRDAYLRGRHKTQLTDEDVEAIRQDRRVYREIAEQFGCTTAAVSMIRTGKIRRNKIFV